MAVVGGIVLPVADGFLRRYKTAVLITAKQRGMGAETVRQRKIKAAVAAVVAVGAVGFAVVVAVMLERCVKLACRRKTQAVRCLQADAVRQHIGGDAAVVFRFAVKFAAAGKLCLVKRQQAESLPAIAPLPAEIGAAECVVICRFAVEK